MSITRTLAGGLVVLALTLSTTAALAAPPAAAATAPSPAAATPTDDAVAHAVTRFEQGQKLYAERNFAGALTEFRKAYEIAPNYRLLYNIGQVCYQMQDYVCAQQTHEQYLASGAGEIPETRRQAVMLELAELAKRIGYLEIQTDVVGAEISVDDAFVGTSPLPRPIPVSAGRHRATVFAAGRTTVTRSVDVAGEDTARMAVVLVAPSGPAKAEQRGATANAAGGSDAVAPARAPAMTTYSWLGYGAGGLLAAGGAVTGVLALSAASDVKSTLYSDAAAAGVDKSRASTLAVASDALLIGAVLTLTATTVLTFILPRSADKKVGLTAGPRSFDGRFTF
jgi:hypothetical protein